MADAAAAAVAPAADAAAEDEAPAAPPAIFSLSILECIKGAQQTNGLRHGNYRRYRQYCSRRLRNLRSNKAVRFMYGKGKQYVGKKVTPEIVDDIRYIHIPLVNAERSWSYAMELQQAAETEPRKRHHQKRRLEKAAKWSVELRDLCAVCGDDRTALEADAYAAWMSGNMMIQRDSWQEALAHFLRCKQIYEQLGQVGTTHQRELYMERVEEVEHSIQYCQYTISVGEGEADPEALEKIRLEVGGSDILQAKLNSVLAESRKKQASALESVEWEGASVPLCNEQVRLRLLQAADQAGDLERMGGDDKEAAEGVYLDVCAAYDDAIKDIRRDHSKGESKDSEATATDQQDLKLLEAYVRSLKLKHQTAHYTELALSLSAAFTEAAAGAPRAEDLVKLYDTLILNMNELRDLKGVQEGSSLWEEAVALGQVYTAFRCYYISQTFAAANKWPQANALIARTIEYAEQAEACVGEQSAESSKARKADVKAMGQLKQTCRSASCRARANLCVRPNVAAAGVDMPIAGGDLLSRRHVMHGGDAGKGHNIIAIPPEMDVIACKPLLFDTAFNAIQYPDFTDRATEKKAGGGLLASLGGWFS